MYTLETTVQISAAHHLVGYDGPCARIHGHNWNIGLRVSTETLDKESFVVDFRDIKESVKNALDHQDLNVALDTEKPTAEFISMYVHRVVKALMGDRISLVVVSVEETPGNKVTYSGDSWEQDE